jgi:hypothetical protein
MDSVKLEKLLAPYNPWWEIKYAWEKALPDYERPVVGEVLADLAEIPQVVSITGPRRVGKSTAIKQVIKRLIDDHRIDPNLILYLSFDDPEIFASEQTQQVIFDLLVNRVKSSDKVSYFFLDEIQRLPKWELFIKKYYDLKHRIRFVVSGSASSPIFRSSQESLLGRVKDRHLLPFSFREYCQYQLRNEKSFSQVLETHKIRPLLLAGDAEGIFRSVMVLHKELEPLRSRIDRAVINYCREGGFPEVWNLPDPIRKIEYLMEQQVRKVLYEDLMTLAQYRKPENVLRFFVYLLANPGVEINTTKIASEASVERRVVEENLPRLEMTDLILRIQKFSHKPLRVRQGNIKCYPVDMALRNAVLKTWDPPDEKIMGLYAENLVVRELIGWPEKIEVAYFREKGREVDFILTHGGNKYLPIEVKGDKKTNRIAGLDLFMKRYDQDFGLVITREQVPAREKYFYLPLRYFLLAS